MLDSTKLENIIYVPKGFMKWIPKGCDDSNSKEKPSGPKFVRGPNLAT